MIRNAGGRAPEALRSLLISQQLLNTQEILVIQHTDCGMLTFTADQARQLVANNLALEPGSQAAKTLNELQFLEFANLEANVKADVEFLKKNELIKVRLFVRRRLLRTYVCADPLDIPFFLQSEKLTGYIYDVKTGALTQVA